MNENPLSNYFRRPSIHMTLPSGGNFYPPGSLNMPETKELPVFPMTAIDEITYKTPDALFNGSAVIDVIKSCIPNIIDPWQIPLIDFITILINIRIASFGHIMEIDTQCPKCEEVATYEIDLRNIADNIKSPDFNKAEQFGDLEIFIKSPAYKQINESNKIQFSNQKMNDLLKNSEMTEDDKLKEIAKSFNEVALLTITTIANSINFIRTPDGDVNNLEFIIDFLQHCDRIIYNRIKDRIVKERQNNDIDPIKIVCDNEKCKHKYEQPYSLDMTTFFE